MATVTTNSSYKIKAGRVTTTVGLVAEAGAIVFDTTLKQYMVCDGTTWFPLLTEPYADSFWVDLLGPATGSRLDSNSTRYRFNFFNGTIEFDNDARNPNEPLVFEYQLFHEWKEATDGKPHLHWKQQSVNVPNWLVGYKLDNNGTPGAIETDFTGYTFGVIQSHAFTYTSGVLDQISVLPDFDLSTAEISSMLKVVLFRDTTNASGLFAGADPSALTEHISDLDIHIEVDTPGSREEYIK